MGGFFFYTSLLKKNRKGFNGVTSPTLIFLHYRIKTPLSAAFFLLLVFFCSLLFLLRIKPKKKTVYDWKYFPFHDTNLYNVAI